MSSGEAATSSEHTDSRTEYYPRGILDWIKQISRKFGG